MTMLDVKELCLERTPLTLEESRMIGDLADHLQLIADISQSDVFIDCPMAEKSTALVVAQAQPATAPSLYKTSVVGQYAYAKNEPAVLFSILSGKPVIGSRGISQEQIAMQQNVVPIESKTGKVIGALIMEQDITEKLKQQKDVERLMETTEKLSETLLSVAMSEGSMQSMMHEGILLFDEEGLVTYTNPRSLELLKHIGNSGSIEGRGINELFFEKLKHTNLLSQHSVFHNELQFGSATFEVKTVTIYREQKIVGGLMLIRDISDLKEKEKQLIIKSAVIKEIHHRVKNNLQTVSSLLRLQMRRSKLDEVKKVYRDSINRINSIAVIHELLAFEGLDTIHFQEVAERICKNIISATPKPEQDIRIRSEGDELVLPSDIATTLALIVNELVQNSVVHAFVDRSEGDIMVSFQSRGQIVSLRIADNGSGFEPDQVDRRGHLGLKITETLVQENLGGIINIQSGVHGTDTQISFPLSKTLVNKEDEQ